MERPKKSSFKPSAIPRLTRQPESNATIVSSTSREVTHSTKAGFGSFKDTRLRQSASRDQLFISSDNSGLAKPRISSLGQQDQRVSHGSEKYPNSPSSYLNPHHRVSRQHQHTTKSKEEGKSQGPVTSTKNWGEKSIAIQNARPSLSERAVETLQNIPSSPALRSRDSTFFDNDFKSSPNSRPNSRSAYESNDDSSPFRGSYRSFTDNSKNLQLAQNMTPTKRPSKIASSNKTSVLRSVGSNSLTPNGSSIKMNHVSAKSLKYESKPLSPKTIQHRSSMQSLLRKPSASFLQNSKENDPIVIPKRRAPKSFCTSDENSNSDSAHDRVTSELSISETEGKNSRKSSFALREQIAKAKAMKRAASLQVPGQATKDLPIIPPGSSDLRLSIDSSNQNIAQDYPYDLIKKRVRSALTEGKLNISAMGLKELPQEVLQMFNPTNMIEISWGEVVSLHKLVAANNEIEELSNDAFPDIDPNDATEDDETSCCQFYSLETIDLRGNKLTKLPTGLKRLQDLTTLYLSGNQLTNECLHIISEISSLRDLALDNNKLTGQLDVNLCKLKNLVNLNLKQNELICLPDEFSELTQLHVLNVSENKLESLPFEAFLKLPITELMASKNKLTDILIPEAIEKLPYLEILDVTSNSLTSISSAEIKLPALHKLLCASNRLKALPSLTAWPSLITINAADNYIEKLPHGLVALPKIKSVNFHGNQLRLLDEKLGKLESLEIIHLTGNPLREKKFTSMTTSELKRTLLLRIEAEKEEKSSYTEQASLSDNESTSSSTSLVIPSSPAWVVQTSGVLDRSNTLSHSFNPVAAAEVATKYQIKILQLHHNNFRVIPESIAFFTTTLTNLNMSHNELSSDTYLNDNLELPELRELNLSSNTFSSLQPIILNLQAPKLERLDISFNRLSSLPVLRDHFPRLTTLLASHNTIRELLPETIKGMHIVDCSSNELDSLNAKIGLLGGSEGLKHLDVSGNRFKVPRYSILEKGTEAILAWLRDRIPAGEMASSDGEEFIN